MSAYILPIYAEKNTMLLSTFNKLVTPTGPTTENLLVSYKKCNLFFWNAYAHETNAF